MELLLENYFSPENYSFYLDFQYICLILGKVFCLTSFVCGYFVILNFFFGYLGFKMKVFERLETLNHTGQWQ